MRLNRTSTDAEFKRLNKEHTRALTNCKEDADRSVRTCESDLKWERSQVKSEIARCGARLERSRLDHEEEMSRVRDNVRRSCDNELALLRSQHERQLSLRNFEINSDHSSAGSANTRIARSPDSAPTLSPELQLAEVLHQHISRFGVLIKYAETVESVNDPLEWKLLISQQDLEICNENVEFYRRHLAQCLEVMKELGSSKSRSRRDTTDFSAPQAIPVPAESYRRNSPVLPVLSGFYFQRNVTLDSQIHLLPPGLRPSLNIAELPHFSSPDHYGKS